MVSKKYEDKILDMLKNYRVIAKKVKEIVSEYDDSARVYVFGSVVRGDYTGSSDIDILIVTDKLDIKYDLMVRIYMELDAPIQLHIVSRELMEGWYMRFIEEDELEEIK